MRPDIVQLPLGDDPPTARLYYGQTVLETLRELPEASVHAACCSPPYWGLRDYHVDPQDWPEVSYVPLCDVDEMRVPAESVALGLEPRPSHYIGHLVAVFREVARVLRPDGTLWLNLGDSYANDGKWGGSTGGKHAAGLHGNHGEGYRIRRTTGLKPKDLVGVPWRAAMALQADGWYLRSEVLWSKPNPMPESVRDRCTQAHEHIFMLARQDRYFYDAEAIREPNTVNPNWDYRSERYRRETTQTEYGIDGDNRRRQPYKRGWSGLAPSGPVGDGRNKRSVWTVPTRPYRGAHFAVWPSELVEPMIKASTSEHGVCPVCGTPWSRVVDRSGTTLEERTAGWEPGCGCGVGETPARAVVLDPFSGSATTGMAALRLGRNYVGIDLNAEYLEMAKARIVGERAPVEDAAEEGDVFDLFGVGSMSGDGA